MAPTYAQGTSKPNTWNVIGDGWSGRVEFSKSGQFQWCLSSRFETGGGQSLMVSIYNSGSLRIIARPPDRRTGAKAQINASLLVDNTEIPAGVDANVAANRFVIFVPNNALSALEQVAAGRALVVRIGNAEYSTDLTGSRAAIMYLLNCVAKHGTPALKELYSNRTVPSVREKVERVAPEPDAKDPSKAQPRISAEIQDALVWTGHYDGLTDGVLGPRTDAAIRAFQTARGWQPTGELTPEQILALYRNAEINSQTVDFKLVRDERARFTVGLPMKFLTKRTDTRRGSRYASSLDELVVLLSHYGSDEGGLKGVFERAVQGGGIDKFSQQVLRDDAFFVSGSGMDRDYYYTARPQNGEVHVVSIYYPSKLRSDMQRYVIAMANSFHNPIGAYDITPRQPRPDDVSQNVERLKRLHAEVERLFNDGQLAEAVETGQRYINELRRYYGEEHPAFATAINNLSMVYIGQGRYSEAEALLKQALGIYEKTESGPSPIALAVGNLGFVYVHQGRYAEAESLFRRALTIHDKNPELDKQQFATTLANLAMLYHTQRRYDDAEPLYRRALAKLRDVLGDEHPTVATLLGNSAGLHLGQGRHSDAEPLYLRSLAILQKALRKEHPAIGVALNNLGELYRAQGRYTDAGSLFKRALALVEVLGSEHPYVTGSHHNLALLGAAQQDWASAVAYWRKASDVMVRRAMREGADISRILATERAITIERASDAFVLLVRAAKRLAEGQIGLEAGLAQEAFLSAQWAISSEAGASIAQMAARLATGNASLEGAVRERQDLVGERTAREKVHAAFLARDPDKRDAKTESANSMRLSTIDTRLAAIDKRLREEFPDYAALSLPATLSVAGVQDVLQADEALVLFLDAPDRQFLPKEETFIWVVTKSDVRWLRTDLGTASLTREVAALRCGLDATAWQVKGEAKCRELLKSPLSAGDAASSRLLFDIARAHALYEALLGKAQDLIKGKHLLIVPSGALTQLPFHVLVTSPPTSSDHRKIAWLARSHAITVLPSVSSLKALRRTAKASAAPRPMIGFANPLLDGDANDADRALQARSWQRCDKVALAHPPLGTWAPRRGIAVEGLGHQSTELASVADLRRLQPLPETVGEVCAVARELGADVSDMRLGGRATEREIKLMSTSGALAQYRIVHFATHGLIAGQLSGTREPGLVLTPPATASPEDDGYLSASEIGGLKLDADWVILSACNTAAGGATNAEALSGLARAFIYAQARALLVSHWEVKSQPTVKLITAALAEIARNPKVGRAEALRRSMVSLLDGGSHTEVHPAVWAPFVVVGEGSSLR